MGTYEGNPAVYPPEFTIPDSSLNREPSSVNVAIEALGDRTAYLRELTEVDGVKRLRLSVPSDPDDGDVYLSSYGVYRFFEGDTSTADGIDVVTATGGRWRRQAKTRNGIVQMVSAAIAAGAYVDIPTSPDWAPVLSTTIHNAVAGLAVDVIDVRATAVWQYSGGGSGSGLKLAIEIQSGITKRFGAFALPFIAGPHVTTLTARCPVTANGDVTVRLVAAHALDNAFRFSGGDTSVELNELTRLDITHFRP